MMMLVVVVVAVVVVVVVTPSLNMEITFITTVTILGTVIPTMIVVTFIIGNSINDHCCYRCRDCSHYR